MSEIDFNELFNDSYEYVMNNDDHFYEAFYTIFISKSPKIKAAFKNTDLEKQKDMLRDAVATMVSFFVTKKASDYLVRLASMHSKILGKNTELYELFVESLLQCLEDTYPKYNALCGIAWRITLAPGIEFMLHCKDER